MENNSVEDNGAYAENGAVAMPQPIPFDPIMASPPKSGPKRVNEVDVLHAKVLGLELTKLSLEVELMKQQMSMITVQLGERERTRNELLSRADTLRAEYLSKYGIDIRAGKINDDGTFSPAPGQRPQSGS